ncbi:FAD/NAD(P)-binding protein [Arenibacter sp. BSSL-BM3]|uniref:FAD/NAD(P)-binding protein n=1 Tax=Arenibacter arenosicollis TaxID=2762274 RepID=A0ABR7QIL8_9FLAO|nr:FAD/NAD(P)-binding protein [Arenibacter arenosicollis]MBC8766832.1 FAD/NAD(P)-binding protein [Arenibacter arenosicollis]
MQRYSVAIVGVGPKGLYAFERLLARWQQVEGALKLEIHLFEKTGVFGAGEIYNPDQPEYLLMNYPNRNINVWPKENPEPVVSERLDFVTWLRNKEYTSRKDIKNGFSPRRTVGKYLVDCFKALEKYKPGSVQIIKHSAEVLDVQQDGDGLILKYIDRENGPKTTLKVNEILLTTGHSSSKGKLKEDQYKGILDGEDQNLIPFVYPVEEKLAAIGENTTVGIKGLGLTFIDTVLAITEGRGGRFEKFMNGNLIYLPSGQEPKKIFPFSRSGLPMIPRNPYEGLQPYTPVYFTVENIMANVVWGQKIGFVEHMLPLMIAEMQYRYYSIVFEKFNLSFYPDKDLRSLSKQINIFHEQFPQVYRFNFEDLFKARPFHGPSPELDTLTYWRYLISEAEMGSESSAFMAAAMTWGRLSETFNTIYSFGGMTADAHYIFDSQFRTMLNRISYGPPLQNMKKILALVEMGLVDLDFGDNPQLVKQEKGWGLYNRYLNFQKIDVLIDARIPTLKSSENWSSLFSNMHQSGLLRPFRNYSGTTYEPGCPDIDRQGRAIDCNGRPRTNISFYGTPTEGVTYDNDTLSRTRNNFASQWALSVLENYIAKKLKPRKSKIKNG